MPALMSTLAAFAARFLPRPTRVNARERARAFLGAGFGILVTGLLARWWAADAAMAAPWLVAPLGANAVLVFALPASPLAQPWPVIGGNVISALIGSACGHFIPDAACAAAVAVAAAMAVMFALRCLHPPGGASALLAALAGVGPAFAVFPMLLDSLLLVAAGVFYNQLTGRRYPHAPVASPQPGAAAGRFSAADLDAALAHYNQVLDVSRDDLEGILVHAEAMAYERNFGRLRCADVMTLKPLAVQFGTTLDEAWALMRQHRIKALPVADRAGRVVGILTVADFMRHAGWEQRVGVGERLRQLLRRDGQTHGDRPEAVGQIMTREVRVISAERRVAELVPLFSEDGHHHIPVIDGQQRLVGIITQSDLVRALYRAAQPAQPDQPAHPAR